MKFNIKIPEYISKMIYRILEFSNRPNSLAIVSLVQCVGV